MGNDNMGMVETYELIQRLINNPCGEIMLPYFGVSYLTLPYGIEPVKNIKKLNFNK